MGSDNNGVRIPASVAAILDPVLATRPDATAIEAVSGAWTYAELDEAAARAAGALWQLGVRPGDRVAACLPNDLPIVAAFHGAQRIGAVWAGIGEAAAASEQQLLCDLVEPSVVLAGPRFQPRMSHAVDPDRWAGLLRAADPAPPVETDPEAPAGIAFTSGTSGVPKAVVHSQRGMLLPGAVTVATRGWGTDLRRGDSFALTILNMMILSTLTTAQAGGTAVIMNRRDADGVAEWIAAHRVTVWNGAPAQLYDLARRNADLSSLREVWSGGSDTSDAVRGAFAEAHGLVPRVTYGLTEAPTVVSIDPPGSAWRPGTSGRVTPQFEVAAYDDGGHRLPAGEPGELRLSPASVGPWASRWTPMLGYWADGRVRPGEPLPLPTGDIGAVDEQGWLRVIDRKKLVIIRGGANVYPLEVERVITGYPGVAAAAVCGIPDERLGQRVAAVVESTGPAVDFDALTAWCRRELASYKVPERWVQVPALPVNAMGKIRRTELAALVTAQPGEPS